MQQSRESGQEWEMMGRRTGTEAMAIGLKWIR
jgi:hypothetical protein